MASMAKQAAIPHRLIGHERQRAWFRHAISQGRLASTFLFVGPEAIGKRTFALYLAQSLFCESRPAADLEPCGICSACIQMIAGTHPDILRVSRPEDRATIPIELLIGARDSRMQEGLCHDIRLRPMTGDRRIAIIDDCDNLNVEGANALLKTLEEPPPRAIIILIGTSLQRQLPTIRSRSQVVRFDPPQGEQAISILKLRAEDDEIAEETLKMALDFSEGDLAKAVLYLSEELRDFRTKLTELLSEGVPEALAIAKLVTQFVEGAGTEAPKRRERLRQASDLAAEYFRTKLRAHADEFDLFRLYRSLDVRSQVDRNANQSTLIEAWADDLQRGHR